MGDVVDGPFGGLARTGSGGPSPADLGRYPLNDLGNAMRLILLAGGSIDPDGEVDATNCRLLHVLGLGWFGFNGRYWDMKFGEDLARKLAHQVAGRMPGLHEFYKEFVAAKDFYKFANDCGSAGKTSAMMRQAQSYVTVELDVFDSDIYAINCLNGTLKLRYVDGKFDVRLSPHDPADRITRCAAVSYDPKAEAVEFERVWRKALPDREERGYFHRVCGYSSTGETKEQAFFLCQGPGQDSKSTLLDACREALGTYGVAAAPDTFLEAQNANASGPQPDLIKLSGDTRFAVLSEPKRGAKFNEGLLKSWTSGSPISARDLNAKPINFRPRPKLIFECNSFPVAKGDDDGIWRRIRPMLFRRKVADADVDRSLQQRLRENELPGILNWLVRGIGDWFKRGLDTPAKLKALVDDWRRSSSPFGDWLHEYCVIGDEAKGCRELSSYLYKSYTAWCEDQGNDKPISQTSFGNALRDRQVVQAGKSGQGQKYRGPVRLRSIAELAAFRAAQDVGLSSAGGGPVEPPQADVAPYEPGSEPDLEWDQ